MGYPAKERYQWKCPYCGRVLEVTGCQLNSGKESCSTSCKDQAVKEGRAVRGRLRSRHGMVDVVSQVQTWSLVTEPCKHKKCQQHNKEVGVLIGTLISLLLKNITTDEAVQRLACFGSAIRE